LIFVLFYLISPFLFKSLFFGQSPVFFVPEPFRGIFVLSLQQQRNPTFSGINIIKCTVARQRESEQSLAAAAINSQTQKTFSLQNHPDQTQKKIKKR